MGAWGCSNFENDEASDYMSEISESKSLDLIYNKINQGIEFSGDYLDASICSECLVAIEILTAFMGEGTFGLPSEINDWITKTKKPRLFSKPITVDLAYIQSALKLIDLIVKESELKSLWEEAGHDEYLKWQAVQNNLIERLNKCK